MIEKGRDYVGIAFALEVGENSLDYGHILDAGDLAEPRIAAPTGVNLDGADAFEAFCPSHRSMRVCLLRSIRAPASSAFRTDLDALGARRREDAVIAGQMRAGAWGAGPRVWR